MKSNSALNKFTKETPELMKRRAEQQLVVNEFNDARSQVIRRLFDQTALYQELFDKNQTMGNTIIEMDINKALTKYLKSIELAKVKVEENEPKPFNDIFGAYSNAVTSINSYINSTGQRPAIAKNYTQTLASSAPLLFELYNLGLNKFTTIDTSSILESLSPNQAKERKPETVKSDAEKEAESKTSDDYDKLISEIDKVLNENKPVGQGKRNKRKGGASGKVQLIEPGNKPKITKEDLSSLWLLYENVRSSYETGQAIADINLAGVVSVSKAERSRLEKKLETAINLKKEHASEWGQIWQELKRGLLVPPKTGNGQNNKGQIILDPQTSTDRLNIERAKDQLYRDQVMNQNINSLGTLLKESKNNLDKSKNSLEKINNTNSTLNTTREDIRKELGKLTTTTGGADESANESANIGNFFTDKNEDLKDINKKIYSNKDATIAYNKTANTSISKALTDKQSNIYENLLREKDTILDSITEHPIYGPKEQKTTTTDVAIFCALTYIIRGISLYLVDWALTTSMISTLAETFFFYIVVYWIIFGVICILVNTSIEPNNGGFANPFKAIIFYLNTDINSSVRIWVHLLIQFILFPILIFISDGSEDPDRNSYQKQKSILFLVSNLSLLMWFLSSIIAFRI
jgi:hypothetical protein